MTRPPIDDLFFELYGYSPNPPGQGFGMLVSAAFKLLAGQEVPFDKAWDDHQTGQTATEADEKGGVTRINLKMVMHVAEYEQGDFSLLFTDEAVDKLAQLELGGVTLTSEIQTFYDVNENITATLDALADLVSAAATGNDDFMASGTWDLAGQYLKYNGQLYGVLGVEYNVPVRAVKYRIVIESNGQAKLFVTSASGQLDKLIKEVDLRRAAFKDGKVGIAV